MVRPLGAPVDTATDRSPPGPIGTWTVDHAHSGVALTPWTRSPVGFLPYPRWV
jgi:hypothetical protein